MSTPHLLHCAIRKNAEGREWADIDTVSLTPGGCREKAQFPPPHVPWSRENPIIAFATFREIRNARKKP